MPNTCAADARRRLPHDFALFRALERYPWLGLDDEPEEDEWGDLFCPFRPIPPEVGPEVEQRIKALQGYTIQWSSDWPPGTPPLRPPPEPQAQPSRRRPDRTVPPGLLSLPARLTEAETAWELRVSIDTVRRLRRRGELGHIRIGCRIFILDRHIIEFLNKEPTTCPESGSPVPAKSSATGSPSAPTPASGTPVGSTRILDRRAAAALARQTFRKPSGGSQSSH